MYAEAVLKKIDALLTEYITNDINYIKKLIDAPEEDVKLDIVYDNMYYLTDFADHNEDFRHDITNSIRNPVAEEDIDILEGHEIWDIIESELPQYRQEAIDFVYDSYFRYGDFSFVHPALHFTNARIFKNNWLIHFTDYPESIAEEGFTIGVDDPRQLGLSTHFSEIDKPGGYNFAFDVEGLSRNKKNTYGKEAVMFRASGVEAYHYGDDEYQVIVYGPSVRDIIPITYDSHEGHYEITNAKTGDALRVGDIEDLAKWVVKNYNQYRKVLHK